MTENPFKLGSSKQPKGQRFKTTFPCYAAPQPRKNVEVFLHLFTLPLVPPINFKQVSLKLNSWHRVSFGSLLGLLAARSLSYVLF